MPYFLCLHFFFLFFLSTQWHILSLCNILTWSVMFAPLSLNDCGLVCKWNDLSVVWLKKKCDLFGIVKNWVHEKIEQWMLVCAEPIFWENWFSSRMFFWMFVWWNIGKLTQYPHVIFCSICHCFGISDAQITGGVHFTIFKYMHNCVCQIIFPTVPLSMGWRE